MCTVFVVSCLEKIPIISMADKQQILNKEKCQKIIRKHLNSEEFRIINYEDNLMDDQFLGLLAEQYFGKIKYIYENEEKTLRVFMKILNGKSKIMFEITKDIKAYEKEAFLYDNLVPTFREKNINMSFIPDFYYCEPYVIILEDLNLKNYKTINTNVPLNVQQCKNCLEILAKFHSATIIYELMRSKELGRNYSIIEEHAEILDDPFSSKKDGYAARYLKHSIEGIFALIDFIPENKISKDDFKTMLSEVLDKITSEEPDDLKCSIIHADVWHNNFLYRADKDLIIDWKLLDFQTIKYGPISLDVLQFLYCNTRKYFRDANYKELIQHYYTVFESCIEEYKFNIDDVLPKSDFLTSCEMVKIVAKMISIVDRCITYLAAQQFGALKTDEEFEKFLFEDRAKYIVECYKTHEEFREVITEDLLELRQLLFED